MRGIILALLLASFLCGCQAIPKKQLEERIRTAAFSDGQLELIRASPQVYRMFVNREYMVQSAGWSNAERLYISSDEEKKKLAELRKKVRASYEAEIEFIEEMQKSFDQDLDQFYYYKFRSPKGETEQGWIICRGDRIKQKFLMATGQEEVLTE